MKKMLSIVIITFIFLSCKKTSFDVEKNAATLNGTDSTNTLQARTENENMVCDDCAALETSYTDTMDNSTVLGNDILNPYTLPNMN